MVYAKEMFHSKCLWSYHMITARAVFNLHFKQICKTNKCLKHSIIFWRTNILLGLQMPIISYMRRSPHPFTMQNSVLDLMASCYVPFVISTIKEAVKPDHEPV